MKKKLEDSKESRRDILELQKAEMRGYDRKFNIVKNNFF